MIMTFDKIDDDNHVIEADEDRFLETYLDIPYDIDFGTYVYQNSVTEEFLKFYDSFEQWNTPFLTT